VSAGVGRVNGTILLRAQSVVELFDSDSRRLQRRIEVGAVDVAALGPFQEIGPRQRTRKKGKSSLFVVISLIGKKR